MITDDLLKMANADAPTTGTTVSSKSVDLQSARDIGEGERLYVIFDVDTTFLAAGGAANGTFQIITTDNADLTGNVKVLASTAAIPKATLVAGYYTTLPIPPQIGTKGQRYLGVQMVNDTNDFTAGAYSARIIKDIEDAKGKEYPSGFSIS